MIDNHPKNSKEEVNHLENKIRKEQIKKKILITLIIGLILILIFLIKENLTEKNNRNLDNPKRNFNNFNEIDKLDPEQLIYHESEKDLENENQEKISNIVIKYIYLDSNNQLKTSEIYKISPDEFYIDEKGNKYKKI